MSLLMNEIANSRLEAFNTNSTFYKGKPCKKNNHNGIRYTATSNCLECTKLYKAPLALKSKQEYLDKMNLYYIKRQYKISLEDYEEMLKKQNFACAICEKEETALSKVRKPKRLSVDHCHNTNKIRGLLCSRCNQGIGMFKHSSELLNKASLYCED